MASVQDAITQSDILAGSPIEPYNMPASIENPNFDLNDPDAYDFLTGGSETPSGVRVSNESALMHPAVWQAVSMISGDVAGLPLEVFQKMPDEDRVKQEQSPVHELIHWQANREMTALRFWRRMVSWKLLWGASYALIERNGSGEPSGLLPFLPDRTSVERSGGLLYVVTEVEGKLHPFLADDVFRLESVSIDTLDAYPFIKAGRQAIGLGLAEIGFASKFYKNGGRVGGILELPQAMPKVAKDKVEEGFRKTYGSNEAFRTIVLRENAKFHQAQVSPADAQVVEARQESVRDIARLFNIRPGKLGEESRASFASKSEDNRDYHDTTLRPHLRDIVQECRSKLLTPQQKREGWYFKHDVREFLAMDFKNMAESLNKLRAAEIINADDARQWLNMNKRPDGGGSEYRNPNTKSAAETTREENDAGSPAAASFRAILASTVKRVAGVVAGRAQRKAGDPSAFLDWIDSKFAEQQSSVCDAVKEVTDAAAISLEIDSAEVSRSVAADFISEAHELLQTIANTTAAGDLKKVVEANLNEWAAEAGDRYARQVFTD